MLNKRGRNKSREREGERNAHRTSPHAPTPHMSRWTCKPTRGRSMIYVTHAASYMFVHKLMEYETRYTWS